MDILAMLVAGTSPEEISRTFERNLAAAQIQKEIKDRQREKEDGLISLSENLYQFLCTYYTQDSKNINMDEVKHMFSPRELDGFFEFVLENCKFEEATFSASDVKINEDLLKKLL